MKKEYIKPNTKMHAFKAKAFMLVGSPQNQEGWNEEGYEEGYSKGIGGSMWSYMEMEEE